MSVRFNRKTRNLSITWTAWASAVLFIVGLIVWLIVPFRFQNAATGGIHFHHFILGLWAFVVGVFSLIFGGLSFKFTVQAAPLRPFSVTFGYVVVPVISALIYFVMGAVLIISEWAVFATWASCPTTFNWYSAGATCG